MSTTAPSIEDLVADKIALLDALEERLAVECRRDFRTFIVNVETPGAPINEEEGLFYADKLKPAQHHDLIIQAVQDLADGRYADDVDGVMVFMPPGSAKSTYTSVLAPAWLLGRKPGTNVIATSYGDELVRKFGRRVRAIVRSGDYEKWMGASISGDNAAVNEWSLSIGSDYKSSGLQGTITGLRADYLFIDDPVKNREDADSEIIREKTWEGYIDNCSTRLKPGGKIFIIMTRWHEDDLCGRLLGEDWKGQSGLWRCTDGRLFNVINLPLLAEHPDDPLGRAEGELLWPEWFRPQDAERLRKAASKGGTMARTWASLYQQRPRPNEGAILSMDYWREWKGKLPECNHVFICYDTAFEEDEDNDFSAMTAWGVFEGISKKEGGYEYDHNHVLLLGAWEERCNAVDLIDRTKFHNRLFQPDRILVEKRASGVQLIQEMQRRRLPVKAWLPPGKPGAKGKLPRAHAVASLLEQGSVWYVPGKRTQRVLEQCAAFPYGRNDDLVDTVTMALSYFRRSGLFMTPDDELDKGEIEQAMLRKIENRRRKRSLYAGPVDSEFDEDAEDGFAKRMTSSTKRRLYGG